MFMMMHDCRKEMVIFKKKECLLGNVGVGNCNCNRSNQLLISANNSEGNFNLKT